MVLPRPDIRPARPYQRRDVTPTTPRVGPPSIPRPSTSLLEGVIARDATLDEVQPQPTLPEDLKPSVPETQIAAINAIAEEGADDEPSQPLWQRVANPVFGALDWYDRNLGKPAAAVGYAYLNPVNWFSPTGREMRENIADAQGDFRERLREGYEETDTPRFAKGATELIADPLNFLPLVGATGRGVVAGVKASRASGILAGGAAAGGAVTVPIRRFSKGAQDLFERTSSKLRGGSWQTESEALIEEKAHSEIITADKLRPRELSEIVAETNNPNWVARSPLFDPDLYYFDDLGKQLEELRKAGDEVDPAHIAALEEKKAAWESKFGWYYNGKYRSSQLSPLWWVHKAFYGAGKALRAASGIIYPGWLARSDLTIARQVFAKRETTAESMATLIGSDFLRHTRLDDGTIVNAFSRPSAVRGTVNAMGRVFRGGKPDLDDVALRGRPEANAADRAADNMRDAFKEHAIDLDAPVQDVVIDGATMRQLANDLGESELRIIELQGRLPPEEFLELRRQAAQRASTYSQTENVADAVSKIYRSPTTNVDGGATVAQLGDPDYVLDRNGLKLNFHALGDDTYGVKLHWDPHGAKRFTGDVDTSNLSSEVWDQQYGRAPDNAVFQLTHDNMVRNLNGVADDALRPDQHSTVALMEKYYEVRRAFDDLDIDDIMELATGAPDDILTMLTKDQRDYFDRWIDEIDELISLLDDAGLMGDKDLDQLRFYMPRFAVVARGSQVVGDDSAYVLSQATGRIGTKLTFERPRAGLLGQNLRNGVVYAAPDEAIQQFTREVMMALNQSEFEAVAKKYMTFDSGTRLLQYKAKRAGLEELFNDVDTVAGRNRIIEELELSTVDSAGIDQMKRVRDYIAKSDFTDLEVGLDDFSPSRYGLDEEGSSILAQVSKLVTGIQKDLPIGNEALMQRMRARLRGAGIGLTERTERELMQVLDGSAGKFSGVPDDISAAIIDDISVIRSSRTLPSEQKDAVIKYMNDMTGWIERAEAKRASEIGEAIERVGARAGVPLVRTRRGVQAGKGWKFTTPEGQKEILKLAPDRDSLTQKSLDSVGAINDLSRFLTLTFDMGAFMIQGIALLATRPDLFARTIAHTLPNIIDPTWTARYISQNRDTMIEMARHGMPLLTARAEQTALLGNRAFSFLGNEEAQPLVRSTRQAVESELRGVGAGRAALGQGDAIRDVAIGASAIGGNATRRAEALFNSTGLVARTLMWQSMRDSWVLAGGSLNDLSSTLQKMTGFVDMGAAGFSERQQSIERALVFFAPRYTRSILAVVGDAFKGNLQAVQAQKTIAAMAAVPPLMMWTASQALGQEPKLDPRPVSEGGDGPEVMTVDIAGHNVGFPSMWIQLARLIGDVGTKDWSDPGIAFNPDVRANPLFKFWRNRVPPNVNMANTLFFQNTYLGEPLETPGQWAQEFAGNFTPFWLDTAMIENGPMQTGNYFAGAAELVGGRTFPVSLWEQMRMEKAKAAEREYGLQWEELNRLQQQNIINGDRYPAIGALQDQINEEMPLAQAARDGDLGAITDAYFAIREGADNHWRDDVRRMELALDRGELDAAGYREGLNVANLKRRGALRLQSEEIFDAVQEALRQNARSRNNRVLPAEDIAYYEYLQDVIYSSDTDPSGEYDYQARQAREAKFRQKWGDETITYISERFKTSLENRDFRYPMMIEELHYGREQFSGYWTDSTAAVAARMPNSAHVGELLQAHDSADATRRAQLVEESAILAQAVRIRRNVRRLMREQNRDLDVFLYRFGYTSTLVHPDNQYVGAKEELRRDRMIGPPYPSNMLVDR